MSILVSTIRVVMRVSRSQGRSIPSVWHLPRPTESPIETYIEITLQKKLLKLAPLYRNKRFSWLQTVPFDKRLA